MLLDNNTVPLPLHISAAVTVHGTTDNATRMKRMSYSSAVMAHLSSSSASSSQSLSNNAAAAAHLPAPAYLSSSSTSLCSSSSASPRGYVPKSVGEQSTNVPKRQQRWKRWRNELPPMFVARSSSASLHSLDSVASSNSSSGIGTTSGAETPPATDTAAATTPPTELQMAEQQRQHSAATPQARNSSFLLDGQSDMARDSIGSGKCDADQCSMLSTELEQFEALSISPQCSSLPPSSVDGHCCSSPTIPPATAVLLVDLSNPTLQHFYVQQRLFFRQIYAQQWAALSARLGLLPSSVEETVFDPWVPHQHLGFPPASPSMAQSTMLSGTSSLFNCCTTNVEQDLPPPSSASPPHRLHLCHAAAGIVSNGHSFVLPSDECFSSTAPPQAAAVAASSAALPLSAPFAAPLASPTVLMMSTAGQTPMHRNRHCSAGSNSTTTNNNKRSSMNSDEAISRMDVLSERIRDFHYNEDQTHAQLNHKLQLRDQLYYAISPIFPMCGLYIVGSSLNGFGTKRSDLDLCLMITNRDIDQRTDAVVILSSVMRALESNKIVGEQNLILAKVPILRIKFVGTFHDITVDLNVNNSVAIRNTHLMCYYSSFDWRVRPLVMVVKEWAKRHGINDSACSSFTSYSLVLMVIHYLQSGAQPSVLPNLQQMYPKRFNGRADVRTLNVSLPFEPIPTAMGWQFKDDATLSELLLGFLRYFAFQFDFDADAISIRMGKKVNRAQVAQNQSPFNTLSQWHCICIEEPFTLSNAAHSVYDERIFQDIKKAFVDSYRELDKNRDLDRFLGPPVELLRK